MVKVRVSLLVIALTVGLFFLLISKNESTAEAEFVNVERADVHQVIPIYGRLVYTEEKIVMSAVPGIASHVYVESGDRVGQEEALVRIQTPYKDEVISAYSAANGYEARLPHIEEQWTRSAIRAEKACNVRQVYVEEGAVITAGMPLLRLTSNLQQVVCTVSPKDAEKIQPGMWAWLSLEGETLCFAAVETVGERKADILSGFEVQEVVLVPEKEIDLEENVVVDADVYLAGSDDVLSLPLEAVTERGTVWWVNHERCTEIPAQIVLHDEMRAWVQLPEGMTVAVGEFDEGQRIREVSP